MKKEKETEQFHEIFCPACGKFVKAVKKKKKTEHLKFECSCSQKFSLTFPGEDWPE